MKVNVKQLINEFLSKHDANLDSIISNKDEKTELYKGRKFLTEFVNNLQNLNNFAKELSNDLTNIDPNTMDGKNQPNSKIVNWRLEQKSGSLEDVDPHDDEATNIPINYIFDFDYKFDGNVYPLSLSIEGVVYFSRTPYRSGNYFTQPEGGEANIDYKDIGNTTKLTLHDREDGDEIDISWLTPQIKNKIVGQIVSNYIG